MNGDTDENKHYIIGDLLWAKIGKYPFWPCMVSYDPYEGRYFKMEKVKKGEERIYHVQYFGKQVQHGWTKAGRILPFEGEEKFNAIKNKLMESAHAGVKKTVNSTYSVPAHIKKLWQIAVKEANFALSVNPLDRFESFVFKYQTKKSALNENSSIPKRSIDVKEHKRGPPPKKAKRSNDNVILKDGVLCKLCEELDADVPCTGDCFQSFHKECLGLLRVPSGFKCISCELGLHSCVICDQAEVSLTKCIKCKNHYHEECIKSYQCADIEKKICPAHTCLTCYNEKPMHVSSKGSFLRCFRCPNIFHKDDCKPVGSESLTLSYIICPDHYLGKNKVSPQPSINLSYCSICSEGGEVICCESCPSSYHSSCIDQEVPSGDFFCEDCIKRHYLYEGMIVWAKTGSYRWWPALIVPEDEIPNNIKNIPQYDGEFAVRYYGTGEYFWTHRGRVIPYAEHHKELKMAYGQSILSERFKLSLQEAARAYDNYLQNRLNEKKFSSKHNAYQHIRVNRAVPPAQIVVSDVKSISPCSCDPNKPNPCGIDSMCLNRSMLMECHPDVCKAKELCENQKFQKRQYASCRIKKTDSCGYGLESKEFIKKGSFVIEYVGEIITHEEYRRRVVYMRENDIHDYYFLYLDSRRMIDAGPKGNLARFINHSCSPNCEMVKWSVNGDSRIGIFAVTDIQPGEELTFHYQSDSVQFQQKCNCGAQNCEGFIGRNGKKNEAFNGKNEAKNGKKNEVFNGKNGKKKIKSFVRKNGVKNGRGK